jgi:hypothetical protein
MGYTPLFKIHKELLRKMGISLKGFGIYVKFELNSKVTKKRYSSSKQGLKHSNMFPPQDIVRTSLLCSYHTFSILSPHHPNPARNGVSWFWITVSFRRTHF